LYNLWPFGNVVVIWHIFPRFGILCLVEKSGNPGFLCSGAFYFWKRINLFGTHKVSEKHLSANAKKLFLLPFFDQTDFGS
jgi:hypothetical protein